MIATELSQAKAAFDKASPVGYSTKLVKELYCWIIIPDWPTSSVNLRDVHYEFRYSRIDGLFAECHIENKDEYVDAGHDFKQLAERIRTINGVPLEYYESRPYPNRRKRPSLSIQLGHNVSGNDSLNSMLVLISETKSDIRKIFSKLLSKSINR